MSVLTDSNNINFEVCHRVLSQSVYALLSLIQAMLSMSTLSTNDQGKSFWELVYGSVNQVLADHRPAVLYDVVRFRLLCKEYLTLASEKFFVVFCCNFWTLQQKPHDYICSAVFIGSPCIFKIWDGRSMGNMVTNVFVKSNCDRLHIHKALGFSQIW